MKSQTEKLYGRHVRSFCAWSDTQSIDPTLASPAMIASYLLKVIASTPSRGTTNQICAALDRWFVEQGHDLPPTRSEGVLGIKRRLQAGPRSIPFVDAEVAQLMRVCPPTLRGLRDRAVIALAFKTHMRRGVLARLTVAARACWGTVPEVDEWLDAAGITDGPVFRPFLRNGRPKAVPITPHTVGRIVKERAGQVGIDPAFCSAESLRAA